MKKKPGDQSKEMGGRKQPRRRGRLDRQALIKIGGWGLIAIFLLIIVMMVASQFYPNVKQLAIPRRLVARVVAPLQKAFAAATDGVVRYLGKLKLRSNIEYEYEQLLSKYDELVDRTMLLEETERKLQHYADLDDERTRNMRLDGIKANVIGWDPSNYTYTMQLNVGKRHGVADNMAVGVPGALIGLTYNTTEDRCNVLAIVDSGCNVAALIESSRDKGTVRGTLAIDGTYACRMYYLSYTTLPRPGDRVVTSGVGMNIPKGIPIGYVRESTRGLENNKQYIVIEPIADFNHIEYVLVYRYRPEVAESAPERDAGAETTFVPLPSIQPVPTFFGQAVPEETPPPPGTETAEPDELPVDNVVDQTTQPPDPDQADSITPAPEEEDGFVYIDAQQPNQTPMPDPTPEPTPSPEPTATFAIEEMTLEEDP